MDVGTFVFSSVSSGNPRLYYLDFSLANTVSPVTSIDFNYTSGAGHGAIMAISGSTGGNFSPIAVTGYNEDIVVEAGAGLPGSLTGVTTATMDTGTVNTANTWYELGYLLTPPGTGLPHPGSIITNLSAPDHRYVLPPSYTANNAVLLTSNAPTATITPAAPANYSNLSFLVAGGNGPITVACVIHFANGSIQNTSFIVPDWSNKSPTAFVANGRVYVSSKTVNSVNAGNPRLYAADIALANTVSAVTSLVLTWQSGASGANAVIFALSGGASAAPPAGR